MRLVQLCRSGTLLLSSAPARFQLPPPASEIETSGCLQEGFISKLLERREIFHPFSYDYCLTRDDLQPDFEDFRLLSHASSLFKPPKKHAEEEKSAQTHRAEVFRVCPEEQHSLKATPSPHPLQVLPADPCRSGFEAHSPVPQPRWDLPMPCSPFPVVFFN